MQQEEKKLFCEHHPESELSVIYVGPNLNNQSRFLCVECILIGGAQYQQSGLDQLVKIKDLFFSIPYVQFRKILSYDIEFHLKEITKYIDQMSISLKKFIDSIKSHLEKVKQDIKSLIIFSAQINSDLEKQSRFYELKQLFQKIKNMDSFQGSKEFKKLQDDVDILCNEFPKLYKNTVKQRIRVQDNQNLVYQYLQSFYNSQQNLADRVNELRKNTEIHIKKIQGLNFFNMENQRDFGFIFRELNQSEKQIKYDLLYQGTRDGLKNTSYWAKCNKQSSLLQIITLKNGNIFGGFSPCQLLLNESQQYHIGDDTMSSFIFQQNKQEIYKLKYKDIAVYCSKDYGPAFGYDFQINKDFSNIVNTFSQYSNSRAYGVDNVSQLIGNVDYDIIECEVNKISQVI